MNKRLQPERIVYFVHGLGWLVTREGVRDTAHGVKWVSPTACNRKREGGKQ